MAELAGGLTTLTLCWRIERRDGVVIGLTAHDRDLVIDRLTYRAAPGMTPSAIERSAKLDVDSMDVSGALSHAAIGEGDLLAGRWNGARVTMMLADWSQPDSGVVPLGGGTIGAVETLNGGFTVELRGMAAALDVPVSEETSPGCRAHLGDSRCRVAMAGRRCFARVTAMTDTVLTLDRAEPVANAYGGGLVRWFGGANSGLTSAIASSDGMTVTLARAPRFVGTGALVELEEGCDKQLATCAGRFTNALNFQGEPYLPGIDLLTRYPGA